MTFVVHCKRAPFDVYIGRPSIWGNPFSHLADSRAEFRVRTREEAIIAYDQWLDTQPRLLAELPTLRGKVLGCWCAPLPCHGHVLSRRVNASAHRHEPGDLRVFVFGSNLQGAHGAGAALYARTKLGALQGVPEGPMPDRVSTSCYAIPTCVRPRDPLPLVAIAYHVHRFIEHAIATPDRRYFVSEVGCGLARYTPAEMAPLFVDAPDNCDMPPRWRLLSTGVVVDTEQR